MTLSAVSFSQSRNSLQLRGLTLLNHFLNFKEMLSLRDFNIPLCSSNSPNGIVPASVHKFEDFLDRSDGLIFAISEAGGHYSASFKNAMDWLIVKNRFNAKLGRGYPLSGKVVFLVTFTPTHANSGDRHFPMTRNLLEEKFGAQVKNSFVLHKCWEHVLPGNYAFVEQVSDLIKSELKGLETSSNGKTEKEQYDVEAWIKQYNHWDSQWKTL